jgi:DNA-binding MarR family transcriptional regulator
MAAMFPPPPSDPAATGRLGALAFLYRSGSSTPGAMAAALRVQPQSLTRTLAALEADGLVTRVRDAADGRQSLIELTQRGYEAMARDVAYSDAWLRERMATELNETEREVLRLAAALMDRLAGDE